MQPPNGGPSPNSWYTRYGCAPLIGALIAGLATVVASGFFWDAVKPVFSGSSKCPIASDNVIVKIDNKNLKEGEKAYLSFEINDPKKLTSDLVFYGNWDSNLKAKIKSLNQRNQSVEYTAPTQENQIGRYIDVIRLTVEDSTQEKCSLLKEERISITKQTGEQGDSPVEFSPPKNFSSLKILPSPSISSPSSPPPFTSVNSNPLIEPTKFVEKYYGLVKQSLNNYKINSLEKSGADLESAYKMLSNPFKQALAPTPYQFQSDWNYCGLLYERESIELKSKNAEGATVSIIFKQPKCAKRALYDLKLNLNSTKSTWLIDSVQRKKYLE